ncbi:hypothetical protein [Halosolutus halophilus]|uniref:hypothetical protein n=1 Tax=Halosolutus halophilus TaxID=1552990 RepID=UPI002234FF88|nr:hypothetical protein [Halosolutus halophilus]
MSNAVSTAEIDPFVLEDADRAHLETNYYEWSDPLDVLATGTVEWDVPLGDNWLFATVVLETSQGTEYTVRIGPDETEIFHDGDAKGRVKRLEPASDGPIASDEVWHCSKCGFGPATQRGVKIHDGCSHEGDPEVLSEAPDTNTLEEEATDDAPAGTGDDVQNTIDAEDVSVDSVDEPDHDESEITLPDGVTVDDVETAVEENETLGDVAHEIGVTRGRARTITVTIGCYGDVKDLPRGGR